MLWVVTGVAQPTAEAATMTMTMAVVVVMVVVMEGAGAVPGSAAVVVHQAAPAPQALLLVTGCRCG